MPKYMVQASYVGEGLKGLLNRGWHKKTGNSGKGHRRHGREHWNHSTMLLVTTM